MWDYIVLGQVPGTAIQVSFGMWLTVVTALLAAVLIYVLIGRQIGRRLRLRLLAIYSASLVGSAPLKLRAN